MNYLISGGTGFIGEALIASLASTSCGVTVLTRRERPDETRGSARVRFVVWDGRSQGPWSHEMERADVVVNLAGKNLFSGRWTEQLKRELVASRLDPVRALIEAMRRAEHKPSVFISVSAVGYYGALDDRDAAEMTPPGDDFLSRLTVAWEAAADEASALGVRTAMPRLGIVLEKNGGALQRMALPFRMMAGGWIGSGRQWVSWIHMEDLLRAILAPVENEHLSGPYNCTSPRPETMRGLARAIGHALHRPCWINVPAFAAKAVLGEASHMLLTGQRAVPARLLAEGFHFHFENADDALENIYR